jgi:hypothetical protein
MTTWIRKKLWNFVKMIYYPGELFLAALDVSTAAINETPSSV